MTTNEGPDEPTSIEQATHAQLCGLRISPEDNGLAAAALALARLLDSGPGARDAAAIAGQLRGALGDLVKFAAANPAPAASPLDELLAKRKARGA